MDTQCCVKVSSASRGECVTTGGLCRPTHLCVAHLNCTKIKVWQFFFPCDVVRLGGGGGGGGSMFQEVGVCLGFQRGAGGFEFRALTAWGKKLLSSLAERALILRYRLPEGSSSKRLWEGWVGSFTILFACKENIQDGGERGTDDFCSCVHCPLEGLAVCCTTVPVPDSDAAGQHALNGSPVESSEDRWRETCSF